MNKKMKKGDYIGVISPSGLLKSSNKEQIDESIINANGCGLNAKLGNYLYKNEKSKEELKKLVEKLYKNNILKKAKGIILGNYSIDNIYFECVFKKYVNNIPMIKCTDFGHCECNVFLPIGAEVELDADKQRVTILNNIFE